MGKLLVGWSEVSITPEGKKIRLAGQFAERISEYVESPVTVTALAIEADGEQIIFCSCDLVKIGENLQQRIRDAVAKAEPEIPTEKIIISAIHTHTSHLYDYEVKGASGTKEILDSYLPPEKQYRAIVASDVPDLMTPHESLLFIVERATQAIVEAWRSRTDARYATGFDRAVVGMCRRVCYSDGSAKMWGDSNSAAFTELEGGNDSGIEMLFFYDKNEKLTGVLATVACPAQAVQHRLFISPDFWGQAKKLLREKYGEDLKVLALCAPAGDQCPVDLIRWVDPETDANDPNIVREDLIERDADPSMFDMDGCRKAGKRIAYAIGEALDAVKETKDEALLKHEIFTVDLPLRRVTPAQYQDACEQLEKFAAKVKDHVNFADNAAMHIYCGTILRWKRQHTDNIVPIEVHIARFGNVAFATNPFELFLDYGNQIRARSRARQTFLIQLACGGKSYLPTEKAEKGGHYSAYVTSGVVGHEGGEQLVRKTTEEINKLFKD